MNYYERIQRSIEFIEEHLKEDIVLDTVAQQAFMSMSNLYRMFFALVGYPVKEYIRLRRISSACEELREDNQRMVEIALSYGFGSQESFIKVFKKLVGVTPANYKKNNTSFTFEKVNLLDKFFKATDPENLEKYPDIKILKELKQTRVAFYRHFGSNPEKDAWRVLQDWLIKVGLDVEKDQLRFFGFDNPYPTYDGADYGFEVWATIGAEVEVNDTLIKDKVFTGGLYAVTNTMLKDITKTLIGFEEWLTFSKYEIRIEEPSLAEVLTLEDINENTKLDLYLPVKLKKTQPFDIVELQPLRVVSQRRDGFNSEKEALVNFYDFLRRYGQPTSNGDYKFYFSYDHEHRWHPDENSWFELSTIYNGSTLQDDSNLILKVLGYTKYAVITCSARTARGAWQSLLTYIKTSSTYTFAEGQWYEEFIVDHDFKNTGPDMPVKLYLPVKIR